MPLANALADREMCYNVKKNPYRCYLDWLTCSQEKQDLSPCTANYSPIPTPPLVCLVIFQVTVYSQCMSSCSHLIWLSSYNSHD